MDQSGSSWRETSPQATASITLRHSVPVQICPSRLQDIAAMAVSGSSALKTVAHCIRASIGCYSMLQIRLSGRTNHPIADIHPYDHMVSCAPLLTDGAIVFWWCGILQIQATRGSKLERTCTCSAPCVAGLPRSSLRGGALHNSKAERCRKVLRKEHSQPPVATTSQARMPSTVAGEANWSGHE